MRRHALRNAAGEASLARIIGLLNRAGVAPLIFKGWAAARHYASPHLRPYGDFDLLAPPSDAIRACKVLTEHADPALSRPRHGHFIFTGQPAAFPAAVDLHSHLPSYYATPSEALFARAEPVILPGGETLLKPCPEDHLRIVILHFLKHGGWRPLWLCDIAAMAETASPHFDWDLCRGEDAAARPWIEAGLAVANELLGCRSAGRPIVRPPRWLVATILREWQAPFARRFRAPEPERTARYVVDKIASYWLNPISSSLLLGRGLSPLRPLHHQIAYSALGLGHALMKCVRVSGRRSDSSAD
jgi:hypothetical protein